MKANNKYEMLFDDCYDLIKSALRSYVQPGAVVLDLGINNGNLEKFLEDEGIACEVTGVDNDAESLADLNDDDWSFVTIEAVLSDANAFIDEFAGSVDAVVVSATLHEINDFADQRTYLTGFFTKMYTALKSAGHVIVGDFFFPGDVTDEEYRSFKAFQLEAINHADAREKFVCPDLLVEVAETCGFKVVSREEIRAVKELNRRYYVVVLEKK